VEVKAHRPAEEEATPVSTVSPRVAEQPAELDEPGMDDHRHAGLKGMGDRLEPEMVDELEASLGEDVASAGRMSERELRHRRPTVPAQPALDGSETAEAAVDDEGPDRHARHASGVEPEPDAVPFGRRRRIGRLNDRDGPAHERGPGTCRAGGQEEPDPCDPERARPERESRGRYHDSQQERAAPAVHTGTGVWSSASRTVSSAVTPAARASGATINR